MEVIPPKIIEIGKIPAVQSSPSMKKNVVMGFILGVVAAAAIVVVITIMDDTLKSEDDIAKYLGISVLAVVRTEGLRPLQRQETQEKDTDLDGGIL